MVGLHTFCYSESRSRDIVRNNTTTQVYWEIQLIEKSPSGALIHNISLALIQEDNNKSFWWINYLVRKGPQTV